jgi:hypothetical protein
MCVCVCARAGEHVRVSIIESHADALAEYGVHNSALRGGVSGGCGSSASGGDLVARSSANGDVQTLEHTGNRARRNPATRLCSSTSVHSGTDAISSVSSFVTRT